MKTRVLFLAIAGLLSLIEPVLAYEIETHAEMSKRGAQSSVLSNFELLRSLGLKYPIDSEQQKFPNSKNQSQTALDIIQDGARFEDANIRSLFHFFDPLHDEGLLFFTSPTWTLEDKGKIHLLQNYSHSDARDHFYKALTLSNEDERKKYFGKTFESLGRVIHHIQDMAQPQHVRSDAHLNFDDVDWKWIENPSLYESYTNKQNENGKLPFDGYAPVNSKDDLSFLTTARAFWHTQNKNPATGLGLAEFTNSNFVSTGTNFRGAFQNGGLIAQPNARYALPAPSPATPSYELANNLLGQEMPLECAPPNNPCVMTFFSSEITDNYRPQPGLVNPKASTASIFDQDLQFHGKTVSYPNLDKCTDPNNPDTCEKIETGLIFALNRFNFDEAHKFLIPRAVAYSSGLIDYFFRGKLEAEDVTFADTGISLRVKNAVDPQKTPAWASEILYAKNSSGSAGSLVVAFDYQDSAGKAQYGVSNTVTMTAEPNGATGIAPGQTSQNVYAFNPPETNTAFTTRSPS